MTAKTKANNKDSDAGPLKAPRRPLSAYNFFFQDQRAKILGEQITSQEEEHDTDACGNKKRKHRKAHGKIGFTALARHVGASWKELGKEERKVYEQRFKDDKVRYQKELVEYEDKLNSLIHLAQVKKALKTIRAQEAKKEASQKEAAEEAQAKEQEQQAQAQQAHINQMTAMTMQQQQLPQNQMTAVHANSNPFTNYCSTGSSFSALLQQAIFFNSRGNGNNNCNGNGNNYAGQGGGPYGYGGHTQQQQGQQQYQGQSSQTQMEGRFKRRCSLDRTVLPAHVSVCSGDNEFPDYATSANSMMFSPGISGESQGQVESQHRRASRRCSLPTVSLMTSGGCDIFSQGAAQDSDSEDDIDFDFLPIPLCDLTLDKNDSSENKHTQHKELEGDDMKDIMKSLAQWDSTRILGEDQVKEESTDKLAVKPCSLPLIDISAALELDVDFPTKDRKCKSETVTVKEEEVDIVFGDDDDADQDEETLDFLQEFIYDDSILA